MAGAKTEELLVSLQSSLAKAERERDQYHELYQRALEQIRKLERGLLGPKAERLTGDDRQLTMELLGLIVSDCHGHDEQAAKDDKEDKEPDSTDAAKVKKKVRGRKPLARTLPRVEIEIVPPDVQSEGLDAFHRIGEERSEQIETRPASKVIVTIIRPKFIRKALSEQEQKSGRIKVLVVNPLDLPIPRSIVGPGMLAETITRRWLDAMPVNRQTGMYAREELSLTRSTICGWHISASGLVRPLIEAMFRDARMQSILLTDATGVAAWAKGGCRREHFWVLIALGRHVLFKHSQKHNSDAVDSFLRGFKGYLVADAHSVYNHLYATGDVVEVACWAHCRRYFFKSVQSDPDRAHKAMAWISALFKIERALKGKEAAEVQAGRAKRAQPIIDSFFAWCDKEASVVLDDTPIQKAVNYARNQRGALQRYIEDGRLPICNNASERELRREAVGRKNWNFVGSKDGAEANANFMSLLASCQMHGIEPWRYLLDLFCLLPNWPVRDVLRLAPAFWRETLKDDNVQRLLDANIHRRVALGLDLTEIVHSVREVPPEL